MPLLDTEPVVILRDLLLANWDETNVTETFDTS